MSLQGSLDTFALPDVMRLLAGTGKTGHLRVDGSRAAGDLWIDAGHVVAADIDGATISRPAVEVLFELLRSTDGEFLFDADMTTSDAGAPLDVEPLLEEAEALLVEWREIEAVVPSLAAWVSLAPELPKSSVIVQADQWRLVAAIGGGSRVGDLGEAFGMAELEISRRVKGIVEAGLATIGAPEDAHEDVRRGTEDDVAVVVPARSSRKRSSRSSRDDADRDRSVEPVLDELAALAEVVPAAGPDASELARQLAELGPEAAQAVAAAAQADTDEEREAALASIPTGADGEPINRGLLLKFLSSVRS